ncbi:type II secretion system F family protein [Streptomyces sp. NBC_01500]|uniref:type II secretion system F family protein n=1 Tax=Streptomyces sp. NBC_01500 TaxID=2903886 RepID=UPI002254375C|nr:type II secretion system F family protein [Streptomyces sp. NBC_01500]MCX4554236.1 type II secretion system F family protein [Streptomyces sp. NBC_01500]
MSTDQWSLLGALCGALLVGGVLFIVRGATHVPLAADRPRSRMLVRCERAIASLPERWAARYRLVAVAAVVAAMGTWLLTERPVHGLLAAAAVLGVPWIWNPAGTSERQIQRLEALAEWLQQLAGVHQAGTTLEAAIDTSAARAPAEVRAPVRTLAARLRMGVNPSGAYRQFADAFADGAVDNVVLLFLTHTHDHGPGLGRALQSMASLTEREANTLRIIDAERAKVRTSTRWVSVISLAIAFYIVTNSSWGQVYRTAVGQLILLVLGGVFAAALVWLRKLAVSPPSPRLLDPLSSSAPRSTVTGEVGEALPARQRTRITQEVPR